MNIAKLDILESTFKNPFNIEIFRKFTKEFFNEPEMQPNKRHTGIWREYSEHIIAYYDIARYTDNKLNKLVVLAVELKKDKSAERARSMQRSFVAKVLESNNLEAAIVAFYSPNEKNWRLSFVRLDYSLSEKGLKLDLTPAKRYSYLVGEDEPNHTAEKQLYPIFADDKFNPSLDDIEKAFSVEKVTQEFFTQYKEKYISLKEFLENDSAFIKETAKLGFELGKFAEQFSKKLMGQLAFLYFLQKKGWLGVEILPPKDVHTGKRLISDIELNEIAKNQDENSLSILKRVFKKSNLVNTYVIDTSALYNLNDHESDILIKCFEKNPKYDKGWGSGSKTFIRDLFLHCIKNTNKNFFNDFLEPLFYDCLNKERGDSQYYTKFNCKIPFLNGGLFEPLEGYHWKDIQLEIPHYIFSNSIQKGDEADGILDIFDRYNFTINEDEPLEKEVAVDPEMLGKIFENLLDVKDRKSKGAFYTPREIVHYMCQESIIIYLVNETDVPYEDIKEFILYGELIKDADNRKGVGYDKELTIKQSILDKIVEIDKALKNVKVADPAVGSGAFPLGMLNEIVRARNNITEYIIKVDKAGKLDRHYGEEIIRNTRSQYKIKWDTIKNCIFAVDIEPSAVDITKLRLWLSVVVEQEIDEQNPSPHVLPNLDCNILVGNSLIDEYEGIKLFDEQIIRKENLVIKEASEKYKAVEYTQLSMLIDYSEDLVKEMFELQDKYFEEDNEQKKKILKEKIEKAREGLIEYKLNRDGNEDGLKKYEASLKDKTKPYFIWPLEFAKVYKEKGGFDIVIGNPPYLRIQGLKQYAPKLADKYKDIYKSATGSYDLYVLFVEKGIGLLKNNGVLNYIMPHKWTNSSFGKGLRQMLYDGSHMKKLISFGAYQVFNASTYTSLAWFSNSKNSFMDYYEFEKDFFDNDELHKALIELRTDDFTKISREKLREDAWVLTNSNITKVISKIERQPLTVKEVFLKIFQGIATSKDSVYFLSDCTRNGEYIEGFSEELGRVIKVEKGLVKPLLKGQQIHRYETINTSNYVIFPYKVSKTISKKEAELFSENEIKKSFPYGYEYLKECEAVLRNRERGRLLDDDYWYRYIYPKNINLFEKEKIMTPEISFGCNMIYDNTGLYHNTKVYSLIKKDHIKESYKFYLAILNSKVLWYYLQNTGYVLRGGYFTFKTNYLEPFPIPKVVDYSITKPFEVLVDYIYWLKNPVNRRINEYVDNDFVATEFEKVLNALVYELYFEIEMKEKGIEFIKYAAEDYTSIDKVEESQKPIIIYESYQRLKETKNIIRNNLLLLTTRLEEIFLPIERSI